MAREATCAGCGQELGIQQIAKIDEDADELCEDCATASPDPSEGESSGG